MDKKKLESKCSVLEKVIVAVGEIYNDPNTLQDQKSLLETIIGAAIWYLPTGPELYSGKISVAAFERIQTDRFTILTQEHKFPRKQAGRELLTTKSLEIKERRCKLIDLYLSEYGLYNLVLKKENRALVRHQKNENFVNEDISYAAASINLVEVPLKEVRRFRKLTSL